MCFSFIFSCKTLIDFFELGISFFLLSLYFLFLSFNNCKFLLAHFFHSRSCQFAFKSFHHDRSFHSACCLFIFWWSIWINVKRHDDSTWFRFSNFLMTAHLRFRNLIIKCILFPWITIWWLFRSFRIVFSYLSLFVNFSSFRWNHFFEVIFKQVQFTLRIFTQKAFLLCFFDHIFFLLVKFFKFYQFFPLEF